MRSLLLAAALLTPLAALAQTAAPAPDSSGSPPAQAAAAPTPPPAKDGRPAWPMGRPMADGPMMHGPMMHGPMMPWMMRLHHQDTFGLLWRAPDLALTPADVEVIAKAILLRHGNHGWSVTDVQPAGGMIGFAFALPDGAVVARFAIDPHSGRIERTG